METTNEDRDLERILRLYEIIKRYEFLVDFLLDNHVNTEGTDYWNTIHRIERNLINRALQRTKNNREACQYLGMNEKTFYVKLKSLGIKKKKEIAQENSVQEFEKV